MGEVRNGDQKVRKYFSEYFMAVRPFLTRICFEE